MTSINYTKILLVVADGQNILLGGMMYLAVVCVV